VLEELVVPPDVREVVLPGDLEERRSRDQVGDG
jgi:hypothetical protein